MFLSPLFQDHAVLQRDQTIPVWGRGLPGEKVLVRLAGHEAETLCSDDGAWRLRLPPLPAGGPHELVAEAGSGRAVARDILVGEVWLCSGQSNMEWKLADSDQAGSQASATEIPRMRLLTIANPAVVGSTAGIDGHWTICTPATLAKFSAVGGWFGRTLHQALGVPVGLICNAWGGSRIQAWISRSALVSDPQGAAETRCFESTIWLRPTGEPKQPMTFEEWERTGAPQDPGNQGLGWGWAARDFDDHAWPTATVPDHWGHDGQPKNGVLWFRRTVEVPATWAGLELEVHLGAVDKHDDTYINGERVGGLSWETAGAWCTSRVYRVPGHLVQAGPLVVAVRARSHVYDGGLTGPASTMQLRRIDDPDARLPLAGTWRFKVEHDWGSVPLPTLGWGSGNHNSPSILFDSRVAPLAPYGLRGAIWYQGEANADEATVYRRMLPLMIRDWRRAWGQGDFPFIQVQLANFNRSFEVPGRSNWAELREAQLMALAEPATGLAVAIDVGEALDVHPRNKRDVGLRLARWALAESYQQGGVPSGPLFTGMVIEARGRVRCRFRHWGAGLAARNGALRSFALAGINRRFNWAEAAIEHDTVVVWCPDVPAPVAVRYAWADNPEGCNLVNNEGLPASPFRSDDWLG